MKGRFRDLFIFRGRRQQFRFGGYARMDAVHNFNNMSDDDINAFYNRDILTSGQPKHKGRRQHLF